MTKLATRGGIIKNIKGINALKSLEHLEIECNKADLEPLSGLKTLKRFAAPLDYLPLVTKNNQLQGLKLRIGEGGIKIKLERGDSIPVLDFSLLKSFPDLKWFQLEWNSVYKSKDFKVLVDFEKLNNIKILQKIPDSLSDQTVEEIRALLPNVNVEIIEKF